MCAHGGEGRGGEGEGSTHLRCREEDVEEVGARGPSVWGELLSPSPLPQPLQLLAHLAPIMAEAMVLERDGLRCDLPQRLPPWGRPTATGKRASWAKNLDGRLRPTRNIETARGTQKNAGLAPVREMLTTGVIIQPTVMFAFDGATHIAASGETFACGDVFSNTNKTGMNDFLRLEPVKRGGHMGNNRRTAHPGLQRS